MGEQGEDQVEDQATPLAPDALGIPGQTPEKDPTWELLNSVRDAWLRRKHNISLVELHKKSDEERREPGGRLGDYDSYDREAVDKAAGILGFEKDFIEDRAEWMELDKEGKPDFLKWRQGKNPDFAQRWESFLEEIAPIIPSPSASSEFDEYNKEKHRESRKIGVDRA